MRASERGPNCLKFILATAELTSAEVKRCGLLAVNGGHIGVLEVLQNHRQFMWTEKFCVAASRNGDVFFLQWLVEQVRHTAHARRRTRGAQGWSSRVRRVSRARETRRRRIIERCARPALQRGRRGSIKNVDVRLFVLTVEASPWRDFGRRRPGEKTRETTRDASRLHSRANDVTRVTRSNHRS